MTSREHVVSLRWLTKFSITLGLYFFWWHAHRIIVTKDRVIHRSGVFGKTERSIPIDRVQDVAINQGLFGRIFGYGDIRIESSGSSGTEIEVMGFSRPNKIRNAILVP